MTWRADGTRGAGARRGRARGALLHGGAGRERAHVPDHHDARGGRGARGASRRCCAALMPKIAVARLRPVVPAAARQDRDHHRHGHDREAGRHRRARQHDARRRRRRTAIASADTNGSCRRRCAMRFWCWRRPPGGLTCFFMPRFRPDGSVNGLRFQRLKDKLGNQSNASSEVEFDDAYRAAGRRGRRAASAPSSRWCNSRGSIARSRRPA